MARSLNAMELAGKDAVLEAVVADRQVVQGFQDLFFKI